MARQVMADVKNKLSRSRELCPGMSEEIYALTDYIAAVAKDSLSPQVMATILFLSIEDIRRGRNGFPSASSENLPEYIAMHRNEIIKQAVNFPKIIDAIADKDFAEEFRKSCKGFL